MSRRRHRPLTEEELALWRHVTQDVVRADRRRPEPAPSAPEPAPVKLAPRHPPRPSPKHAPVRRFEVAGYTPPVSAPRQREAAPPLGAIERPVRQRLARGRLAIDAAIDLHGLRQDEAHRALRAFLQREQAAGARIVLVVTGKGASPGAARSAQGFGEEAGVLRRHAPHWLSDPQWRRFVSGFDRAGRGHGGEGAIYVRLRRLAGDVYDD
jgi:DNA-nicking Smr family endonuclease